MKSSRRMLLASTALTPFMMLAGAHAASAQAVSAPNATFGGFGGQWNGYWLGAGELRLTAPLTPVWGAQFDGIAGTIGGQTWGEAAGHIFTRDPSIGLLGLYGAWTTLGGGSNFRIGPEAEVYGINTSVSAVAGFKTGGTDSFFAQLRGSWYVDPNTKFYAGFVHDDWSYGLAGFEHQFGTTGVSFFSEVRAGTSGTAGWAGLRFYLGPKGPTKTLINRERQDVAPLWVWVADSSVTNPSTTPPSFGTSTSPPR